MQTKTRSDRRVAIGYESNDMGAFHVPSIYHAWLSLVKTSWNAYGPTFGLNAIAGDCSIDFFVTSIVKDLLQLGQYHRIQRLKQYRTPPRAVKYSLIFKAIVFRDQQWMAYCYHWDAGRVSKCFDRYHAGTACHCCRYSLDCRWDTTDISKVSVLLSSETAVKTSKAAAERYFVLPRLICLFILLRCGRLGFRWNVTEISWATFLPPSDIVVGSSEQIELPQRHNAYLDTRWAPTVVWSCITRRGHQRDSFETAEYQC